MDALCALNTYIAATHAGVPLTMRACTTAGTCTLATTFLSPSSCTTAGTSTLATTLLSPSSRSGGDTGPLFPTMSHRMLVQVGTTVIVQWGWGNLVSGGLAASLARILANDLDH